MPFPHFYYVQHNILSYYKEFRCVINTSYIFVLLFYHRCYPQNWAIYKKHKIFESHSLLFVVHFHQAYFERGITLQITCYHIIVRKELHTFFFNLAFNKKGRITKLGDKTPQSFSGIIKYRTCLPIPLSSSQAVNDMTKNWIQEHQHTVMKGIFLGKIHHNLLCHRHCIRMALHFQNNWE